MKFLDKNCTLFLIFTFCFLFTKSQWYDPDKINKKAGEIYAMAYEDAQAGKYTDAINKINVYPLIS